MRKLPEINRKRPDCLVVLCCGSRHYSDVNTLDDCLDRLLAWCETRAIRMVVVQGGTPGAAAIAREWAWHNEVPIVTERADWLHLGHAEGRLRNQQILDRHGIDLCLCTEGEHGTNDMVDRCHHAKLLVIRPAAL